MSKEKATEVIAKLQVQRQKFLDGLEANQGDINLKIFEDFYPDKAHFVFELLQNAEDTKASECHFKLTRDAIEFRHNGTRKFCEQDVKSITGIHDSTKVKEDNKIGKFGVGFKSVFIYTLSPEIHSGDYAFAIRKLVMPEYIPPVADLGVWTMFRFPFNNPDKPPLESYSEIREGLEGLSELTLLFLKNIESVSWDIENQGQGELLRIQHSQHHIEVLRQWKGQNSSDSHFLRFSRPIATSQAKPNETTPLVSIAYPLEQVPESSKPKDNNQPTLSEKYKITPAVPGRVSVFFPAEKESSGLRFHLHAPFVPTLDRSSIKEIKENESLYSDLALLAAQSLHDIKDLGMLTRDLLNVLPYETDEIPLNYRGICASIISEMNEHSLTPTYTGGHAPAKQLLQAKRPLKELLQPDDIQFLLSKGGTQQQWAIGAPNNSAIDRFLKRLDIQIWDTPHFFEKVSRDGSYFNEEEEGDNYRLFIDWLGEKDAIWLQNFYSLGYELLDNNAHSSFSIKLDYACIVRTGTGDFVHGCQAFFPGVITDHEDRLPRVDPEILTIGKTPKSLQNAKLFLEKIGVKEVDEKVETQAILSSRYYPIEEAPPSPHLEDITKFLSLFESNQRHASIFQNVPIFKCDDGDWVRGQDIFIDTPFKETGLKSFADRVGPEVLGRPLSLEYLRSDINTDLLVKFCITLGAMSAINYEETRCCGNPDWSHLNSAPGNHRYDYCVDRDFTINNFNKLFDDCPESVAKTLWGFMIKSPKQILIATYRQNSSNTPHYAPSQLVHLLRNASWIPQQGSPPVKPSKAYRDMLPPGFSFDPSWDWIKAIEFGSELEAHKEAKQKEEETIRKYLNLEKDIPLNFLETIKQFMSLPQEKQEEYKQKINADLNYELSEFGVRNPDLREDRAKDEAREAQERTSREAKRSIAVGQPAVKQAAKAFLRQEYTNDEGIMMCQICKGPLPFKALADGAHYFEAVEFLPGIKKKPHKNYLALCPNHAAAFKHANHSKEIMPKLFTDMSNKSLLGFILAEQFQEIYFTERHKIDLLAITSVEQEPNDNS